MALRGLSAEALGARDGDFERDGDFDFGGEAPRTGDRDLDLAGEAARARAGDFAVFDFGCMSQSLAHCTSPHVPPVRRDGAMPSAGPSAQ